MLKNFVAQIDGLGSHLVLPEKEMKRQDPLQTESRAVLHRFGLFPRDVSLGWLIVSEIAQGLQYT